MSRLVVSILVDQWGVPDDLTFRFVFSVLTPSSKPLGHGEGSPILTGRPFLPGTGRDTGVVSGVPDLS